MEAEVWRAITGFEEKYAVSSRGRIFSNVSGKILKPYRTGAPKNGGQYLTVELDKKPFKVHRLVAEAFLLNPLHLPQVNHKDGNKDNNNVENLEWCTAQINVLHSFKNGLSQTGEEIWCHRLTEVDVAEIRKKYRYGDKEFGTKPLARAYGVSNTTIRRIVKNKKWRYCHETAV